MAKVATARTPVARAIAEEVRAFCRSKADPERANKYARYFTEGYDAYGVNHKDPEWGANLTRWAERLREAGPEALLETGNLLVASGKYEEASFAVLLAAELREFYSPALLEGIGRWFEGGIRNWGHTDVLCGDVLGRFLVEGTVSMQAFASWRDSQWKFQRRAVPVSLIKVLPYVSDLTAVLRFVEPLMMDGERVVQQGMGWFLREAWKRDRAPVEQLLLTHRQAAPRLIYQYATEKMTPKQRERFRRK